MTPRRLVTPRPDDGTVPRDATEIEIADLPHLEQTAHEIIAQNQDRALRIVPWFLRVAERALHERATFMMDFGD